MILLLILYFFNNLKREIKYTSIFFPKNLFIHYIKTSVKINGRERISVIHTTLFYMCKKTKYEKKVEGYLIVLIRIILNDTYYKNVFK